MFCASQIISSKTVKMAPIYVLEEKDVAEVSIAYNEFATDTCPLCVCILLEKSNTDPNSRRPYYVWKLGEFLGATKKLRNGKCRGCAVLVKGILQNQWFDSAALANGFHIEFLSATPPRLFMVKICDNEYDPKSGNNTIYAFLEYYISGNRALYFSPSPQTAKSPFASIDIN